MNKGRILLIILLLLALFMANNVAFANETQRTDDKQQKTEVLLQLFGWDSMASGQTGGWYQHLTANISRIAGLGATMVWLPPISRSVSQQGYLPGDLYDLGTADNPTFYGDEAAVKSLIASLHKNKIKVLADIVINHRCAGQQDENGIWNVYHFPSGKAQWENWAVCNDDVTFNGTGNEDSGEGYGAAPDVDHHNKQVQKDIITWMKWLKKQGIDGWRYDYVKGYSPFFTALYDKATAPCFSVGEYWTSLSYKDQFDSSMHFVRGVPVYNQDYHRQQLCDWLDRAGEKVTAFDFTTKGILQEAVKGQYWRLRDPDGKASGLLGWWPSRSVTFIDNHDTGSKQQHWPFPEEKVLQGYAYILTHPGTPCVFWEHAFDWNLYNPIKKLIEARKTCGIHANSRLEILKAEEGLYVAKVDNRLLVKLGWQEYTPTQGAIKLTSGDQFCVWQLSVQKTDATQPVEENMEERDYFPGYGAADPNYNYRLGRELDSELLKAEWVIHRKTIFENQDYELNISTDILDQLFESHPDTKVRRRFPFQLKLTWITAADVAVHTKKKLFFRKQLKMGEFKRWFELLRKKKSWLPTGEWEKCGKTYRFFQEPVTESVATEFRVLDN